LASDAFRKGDISMPEPTLIELLQGKSAHANPIACVEDLSAALAARAIDGFPNSIWQLLSHMNYWMDYEIQRIEGRAPEYPEHATGSWLPHPAPPSTDDWTRAVAHFRELITALMRLAESDAATLCRQVAAAHAQQAGQSSTVGAILWQTMAHNSYHTGQIAMLRRCLGAWPPRLGGDTW
jgi:uncharacterized damage-inducible protein DinB